MMSSYSITWNEFYQLKSFVFFRNVLSFLVKLIPRYFVFFFHYKQHSFLHYIFFKNLFILFIYYFWLHWVFVAARRLSLAAASGGYSLLQCAGFSLQWLLLLQSTGSRHMGFSSCGSWASVIVARGLQSAGSVVVALGLSCSVACGIFPDQGSNPCPLHWQADS